MRSRRAKLVGIACLVVGVICASIAIEQDRTNTASAVPRQSGSSAQSDMRQVAQAWAARYNAGDSAGVANLYTEDGYYASAHVLAHGRPAIERYWARGIAAGGHIDFIEPVKIGEEGDLGYLLGKYKATNAGVTVDGRVLIVGKRMQGKWYIAAHETVVRDQPE